MIDRDFLIWFAGFVDGEGCIGIYPCRSYKSKIGYQYRVFFSVCNTDEQTINLICSTLGGRINKTDNRNWKIVYRWVCSDSKIKELLENISPFLKTKRNQAQIALEFYKTMNGFGSLVTKETYRKREELSEILKSMKS